MKPELPTYQDCMWPWLLIVLAILLAFALVARGQPMPQAASASLVVTNEGPELNKATLAWDASANADSYKLFYKTNGAASYQQFNTTTGTSNTVTNLVVGWTYNFVVHAVNSSGESTNSNEVTYTVPWPPPPTVVLRFHLRKSSMITGTYTVVLSNFLTLTNPTGNAFYDVRIDKQEIPSQ